MFHFTLNKLLNQVNKTQLLRNYLIIWLDDQMISANNVFPRIKLQQPCLKATLRRRPFWIDLSLEVQ